jgi:hypothetical protein
LEIKGRAWQSRHKIYNKQRKLLEASGVSIRNIGTGDYGQGKIDMVLKHKITLNSTAYGGVPGLDLVDGIRLWLRLQNVIYPLDPSLAFCGFMVKEITLSISLSRHGTSTGHRGQGKIKDVSQTSTSTAQLEDGVGVLALVDKDAS